MILEVRLPIASNKILAVNLSNTILATLLPTIPAALLPLVTRANHKAGWTLVTRVTRCGWLSSSKWWVSRDTSSSRGGGRRSAIGRVRQGRGGRGRKVVDSFTWVWRLLWCNVVSGAVRSESEGGGFPPSAEDEFV